ncbi:MAG: glycosyltransferase family 4 protein [Desulfovibrio sp.]|nr:glycosyltransferase family 4 protein [Desulfovibrio sp.]
MLTPGSIAILAPSPVPFQSGGAEKFWWGLRNALAANSGALVELIKLPTPESTFAELVNSYEMFSKLNLNHFDMLVTSKYPAWIVSHPQHFCYMLHRLRGVYDLYPRSGQPLDVPNPGGHLTELLSLLATPDPDRGALEPLFELTRRALNDRTLPFQLFNIPGPLARLVVHFLDRIALNSRAIRGWLAISGTVARRADYFPADAEIRIVPPPSDLGGFDCAPGKYFFTASRMSPEKRIYLLVEAMAHFPLDIPLKIAGTGSELERLRKLAEADSRIHFLGHVADAELSALYASAIAVPFVPYEEDYGLITIEAMKSGKPVITTRDSGGVCEFVEHEKTGLITDPAPQAIARAMLRLAENPDTAETMGLRARASVANINWRQTALGLLEYANHCQRKQFPALLAVAPFRADRSGEGGNRRLYHFCKQLESDFEIRLVCYGRYGQQNIETIAHGPRFHEISVPWSREIRAEAERIKAATGESAGDIAMMRHAGQDEQLAAFIKQEGAQAEAVILGHPWLYPVVKMCLPNATLIYDAYNVEIDIKAHQFGDSAELADTRAVEQAVCKQARLVCACSGADAARLQELYKLSVSPQLLPHGCEAPDLTLSKTALRKRLPYAQAKLILFVGSYHGPNIEAAAAILEMARQVPEAQFLIAGSVCEAPVFHTGSLPVNVHALGKISEKAKNILLQASDMAINPVTSGSGVNLKSLEYIAFGLPLISTPFGMRGLPANLEPAVQICELESFPSVIRRLLAMPRERDSLEEIRARFIQAHLWEKALAPLAPAIKEILTQPACSAKNAGEDRG